MPSSGMLRHVALVRTDVSEELSSSIIRATITDTRCKEILSHLVFLCSVHRLLVTANVPSLPILVTLMMEVLSSSETSVFTRATWCNIQEDNILHSHRCENFISYTISSMSHTSTGYGRMTIYFSLNTVWQVCQSTFT
jgi:hypothetical protein